MDTENLSWWKNVAEVAAFALAGLAAVAAAIVWFTGRELEKRRTAGEAVLRDRVTTSETAAADARRDADVLRQRLAPRILTPEQQATIAAELRRVRGNVLITYPADQEAQAFAKQLQTAIASAGWDVEAEGGVSFGPVVGLWVKVRSWLTPEFGQSLGLCWCPQ